MAIDLTSACVAQYKMNDNAASSVVIDSKGFSNGTARQNTSVLHTTGKIGGALSFNGTSDYIDFGTTFQAVMRDSFSINLWAYSTDYSLTQEIMGVDEPHSHLYLEPSTEGAIHFLYNSNDTAADVESLDGVLVNSRWQMLTFIAQKAANKVTLSIFVDGALVAGPSDFTLDMSSWASSRNMYIGAVDDHVLPHLYYPFLGNIDNVTIFNKALSADEISFLYYSGAGTEKLTGQLGEWSNSMLDELAQIWGF